MDTISRRLPLPLGLRVWAQAASVAGAMLPAYVVECLEREAAGGPLDAEAIMRATLHAARACMRDHRGPGPAPRGLHLYVSPRGQCDIVWFSDNHTVSLAIHSDSGEATVIGIAEHDGPSERLRIIAEADASAQQVYYAVADCHGPISRRLEAAGDEEAMDRLRRGDHQAWLDEPATDLEDVLGDPGAPGTCPRDFAERLRRAGLTWVGEHDGWDLWRAPR